MSSQRCELIDRQFLIDLFFTLLLLVTYFSIFIYPAAAFCTLFHLLFFLCLLCTYGTIISFGMNKALSYLNFPEEQTWLVFTFYSWRCLGRPLVCGWIFRDIRKANLYFFFFWKSCNTAVCSSMLSGPKIFYYDVIQTLSTDIYKYYGFSKKGTFPREVFIFSSLSLDVNQYIFKHFIHDSRFHIYLLFLNHGD